MPTATSSSRAGRAAPHADGGAGAGQRDRLSFLDSRGTPHARGSTSARSSRRCRSRAATSRGATPATAIWSFGSRSRSVLATRRRQSTQSPASRSPSFLPPDSIEGLLDRVLDLRFQIASRRTGQAQPDLRAGEITRVDGQRSRETALVDEVRAEYEAMRKRAEIWRRRRPRPRRRASGRRAESCSARSRAARRPIPIEMTFNVYRTTKGRVGEPVYAEIQVSNPHTGKDFEAHLPDPRVLHQQAGRSSPRLLAGSPATLRIEVRCISPTQYLGHGRERPLPPARARATSATNFMKGLFGVWLQAMVLTAIGVFAGTFLSWPVALLTTIAFFVAGQVAFGFLLDFTRQTILGGGPFESLDPPPDAREPDAASWRRPPAVVTAKTLDSLVMPVMSLFVYVVPNFQALDVSNTVADGFAVGWSRWSPTRFWPWPMPCRSPSSDTSS